MKDKLDKFIQLPLWAKIMVILFLLLLFYAIGEVDIFLESVK